MSMSAQVNLDDLYSVKVDEGTIDYILNHFNEINTPIYYEQIMPQIPVKPLGVLGVFGVQATISAILLFKQFGNSIKYVATTESVVNNPRFSVAKKVVDFAVNSNKELVILPDEITTSNFASILKRFSVIFQQFSMHASGMPSDLLSLISIVSLGQKWIFNVQKRKFIII
ncbi:MAG: hypothetical protein RXN86_07115 [Vulcanisaeta sp.]